MIKANYEEKVTELKEKGEVEILITDCDLQFYIEDALESLNLKHRMLLPPRKKGSVKVMIIKIID
ncbi:MAG: hypothetical protein ACQEWV_32325 [Bacillota bacterium]